jgi:hypothetical protein
MRPKSFAASLGVHSAIVTLLVSVSSLQPQEIITREEVFRPQDHKIIFYDFRRKTPEVRPLKKVGKANAPHGAEVSEKTIIATSPKARSKEQLIWTPAPKIEIPHDLPIPNLIASVKTAPPPEEPKPVPEPQPAPKPPPRAFIPPAPKPKLPLPAPVQLSSSDLPSASPISAMSLPNASMAPILSTLVVAAPAPVAKPGEDKVDVAVASLHPVPSESEVPEGARGAKFSQAPEKGRAASGDVDRASVTVPNLTMHEEKKSVVVPVPKPTRTIVYAERIRSIPSSTLSVPLRPAARTIPRALELRFQGRSVYTMVVPIENLPAYSGDWIVWFAEHDQKLGTAPLVRAPLPYRKFELIDTPVSSARTEQRIQIAAVVKQDGQLEDIAVLTKAAPGVTRAALEDLASWEFKPASRDGAPITVDVVIEIPFSFPQVLATRTQ